MSLENLIAQQKLSMIQLARLRTNFKKASSSRKTASYCEKVGGRLQELHETFEGNHKAILLLLKGEDSEFNIDYFANEIYLQFDEQHLEFSSEVDELLREAIAKQRAAEQQEAEQRKVKQQEAEQRNAEQRAAEQQEMKQQDLEQRELKRTTVKTATGSQVEKSNVDEERVFLTGVPQETQSNLEDIKLPRITIPKFHGSYDSWISFRDLFTSLIHNRSNLSKVQKLHYLKCSLAGEAEGLLRQYAVTDANYDIAWRILNDRYDNINVLLNTQLKRLFALANANESSSSIKTLLDRAMECVQAIENMGIENLWHATLVFVIIQRLPHSTRQLWEQEHVQQTTLPSLNELLDFMHRRFRALQAAGVDRIKVTRNISHQFSNMQSYTSQTAQTCVICKADHHVRQCPVFGQMNHDSKFEAVKRNKLCINCLTKGHMMVPPSSLNANASEFEIIRGPISSSSQDQTNVQTLSVVTTKQVLLATALVRIRTTSGSKILRALLDQGSQASFISENAIQRLALPRKYTNTSVSGIGKASGIPTKGRVNLSITLHNEESLCVDAYILNQLTNALPTWEVTPELRSQLKDFNLADPNFDKSGKIDMLLGADVYAQIITGEIHKLALGPIVQKTKLGWIVSGRVNTPAQRNIHSFKIEITHHDELNIQLRRFWELEEIGIVQQRTKEEQNCEEFYLQNTERNVDGKYVTRLPFTEGASRHMLGSSRNTAVASLMSLERKFSNDPILYTEYSKCIQEYLDLNHMHEIHNTTDIIEHPNGKRECKSNYLPHHVVYKDSTTTKARVVFDASRKTSSGVSLNDLLYAGPVLQTNLDEILLKWRCLQYVFAADIEKMYRQIRVHTEDADLQRIVWRNSPNEPIRDYCLNTVTFGVTCAPFLAIRTLRKLAEESQSLSSEARQAILSEMYVDDLLSGGTSLESAVAKRDEIKNLLSSAGFKLRKWAANHNQILHNIPIEDCETLPSLDMNLDNGLKTLGIIWYPVTDEFGYKININIENVTYTKRKILSDIARLFDPLGWISPVVILAKILMQALWLDGVAWDDRIPMDISNQWHTFKTDLNALHNLRIPRWLRTEGNDGIELHGFSDASQKAYAAVVYVVSRSRNKIHSSLIIAKTKVAPVKAVSIPRLELCAALLLAKTVQRIIKLLNINTSQIHLWTDSTIVLAWLSKHPSNWTTFVANRTTQIYEAGKDVPWNYVPSEQNPADVASRGLLPSQILKCALWWNGPSWIRQDQENWPVSPSLPACTMEKRKNPIASLVVSDVEPQFLETLLARYSSLTRLIRITSYCFRFMALLKGNRNHPAYLSTTELDSALKFWIKYTQRIDYHTEIECLKNELPIDNKNNLLNLNPILDVNGILRIGGRITNANLPYDAKHPILISKLNKLLPLLLLHYHTVTLHGGVQLMLNVMRQKYWIINARNSIRHFIHKCIVCYKQKAQTRTQLMGNLPTQRVTPSRPFSHCGVDYCGPIDIKVSKGRGSKSIKGYIAIFVCLSVKAIHLELVGDLSTQTFLAAFKRFVSRRGLCSHVYSDCGTNFVGASKELREIVKRNEILAQELANDGISWHFNPPASPHFGGLWEAGVKSTKHHLRRIVGNTLLTYEELNTVLAKIEACLNSRPLCPLTNDPADLNASTPGHFLVGETLLAVPEDKLLDIQLNRLDRWQLTQRLTQDFWKRWSIEYVSRLQQRPKWNRKSPDLEINDLVLIKDERLPAYKWPMGRIIKTHYGKDGLVRVVTVRTANKEFDRPITKIAVLPIEKTHKLN